MACIITNRSIRVDLAIEITPTPPDTKETHRKTTSLISILPVHIGGAKGSGTEGGILGSRLMSSKTCVRECVVALVH